MNKKFLCTQEKAVLASLLYQALLLLFLQKNINTILISIDQAHSLSDIFGIKIGGEITKVCENLSVLEIDSSKF